MKRLTVTAGLLLCMALPASAQMYKWIDANGKVQYSDKPPPSNIKTEKLREAPPPPAPKPAAAADTKDEARKDAAKAPPKSIAEQEQSFRKRQIDAGKAQEERNQKEALEQAKAENCRRARAALTSLQAGGRQVRIDEKGERVFLDDQQIADETARANQEAARACN